VARRQTSTITAQTCRDNIYEESFNVSSNTHTSVSKVLWATSPQGGSSYDEDGACNPAVVAGQFSYGGTTYSLALYYVVTTTCVNQGSSCNEDGENNDIMVAFSNNNTSWTKDPTPVVTYQSACPKGDYGVGSPSAYNQNGAGGIILFYVKACTNDPLNSSSGFSMAEASSTNGFTFGAPTAITTNGMPTAPADVYFGYDYSKQYWYAAVGFSTTLGTREKPPYPYQEDGGYTVSLFRIPVAGLTTGSSPWQLLDNFDTSLDGYELNQTPGLLRDEYGNVNGSAVSGTYPQIEAYFTTPSRLPAADASQQSEMDACAGATASWEPISSPNCLWEIDWASWNPNSPEAALVRYYNPSVGNHEVTTGYVNRSYFTLQDAINLGYLYEAPTGAATQPLYDCKVSAVDYMVSTSSVCESSTGTNTLLGILGYSFPTSQGGGPNEIPLYRCHMATGAGTHFVSNTSSCEGQDRDGLLGYSSAT
jgi:hypothetical protein